MIVVQLTGGLGNQLFQYSAAKALSLHHKVPLKLDISSFYRNELPDLEVPRNFELNNFPAIKDNIITTEELKTIFILTEKKNILNKLKPAYKKPIYEEPHFHYDKNFFKSKSKVLLKGGWQSEKYFGAYKTELKKILQLDKSLIINVIEQGEIIKTQNSVSIHVRRGDYLRKQIILEWHGVMEQEYYKNAFDLLSSKISNIKVYYFTDDPEWVSQNLVPIFSGEIISLRTKSHYEDLYLMSQCKHNIIANSSFSWWGAWLNAHTNNIVIAPNKWFGNGPSDTQDLLPDGWYKI